MKKPANGNDNELALKVTNNSLTQDSISLGNSRNCNDSSTVAPSAERERRFTVCTKKKKKKKSWIPEKQDSVTDQSGGRSRTLFRPL